jgi:large subunit ribosomal protein L28
MLSIRALISRSARNFSPNLKQPLSLISRQVLPVAVPPVLIPARGFILRPKRSTKKGLNVHKSNKAKTGLYHGKDVRSGHSISHSHHKTKRQWHPNVIRKRVWSETLDTWIRFRMTTTALKEIDALGGIDNYL